MLEALGRRLAAYLSREGRAHTASPPTHPDVLRRTLRPADILLIEGGSLIATAIKYLTQSTWSHAALYLGDAVAGDGHMFIEADLMDGVHVVGLERFTPFHCRICRPVGLSADDVARVLACAIGQIGHAYDTRNVVDLARYLFPTPPAPAIWRRDLIAFGSGDPTRAICSGLIAQCFEAVNYPVLPDATPFDDTHDDWPEWRRQILRVRDHRLYVPRDFDVSPYFEIVKPSLAPEFDYRALTWASGSEA